MRNTLRISFSLKNTYRVNSILYAIKQIPILKKILPDSLYRMIGFKIAGNIISCIWEVLSAVFGKVLYFLFLCWCTAAIGEIAVNLSFDSIYMNLFLFLTLVGAVTNLYMFDTHKSKYYAIMLLNVDAKKYNLINYIYSVLKLLVCYIAAFLILSFAFQFPLWLSILAPFFTVGVKAAVVALTLKKYKATGKPVDNNLFGKLTFPFVILCAILGAGLPALGYPIPYFAMGIVMAIGVVLGVFGFVKIFKFDEYRQVSREVLLNAQTLKADPQKTARDNSLKTISSDTSIKSSKKGFEFLNELFIKRHSKILWKPVLIISAVCFAVFSIGAVVLLRFPEAGAEINDVLLNSLPYFLFIMYAINRGTSYTQALFINCDHSLLTYSVYKKPKNILKLFTIRLREITKMNLVPAAIIGLGLAALLFVSGGTDNPINYAVLFVSPLAMSVFFSVHNLTIYYLLQPYNANTEIKSGMYQVIMGVTYMACYVFMQIELPTLYFGISMIIFCVLYCIVSSLLIYKYAPKTFRIRA